MPTSQCAELFSEMNECHRLYVFSVFVLLLLFYLTYHESRFSSLHGDTSFLAAPFCRALEDSIPSCYPRVTSPDKDSYAHQGPLSPGKIKPSWDGGREVNPGNMM